MSQILAAEVRPTSTPEEEELPPPRGTLFVLTLYVMILAGMWSAVYWIMLQRS